MGKMTFFLANEMKARKMITGDMIRNREETPETTNRVFDLLEIWYEDYKTQNPD